MELFRELFATAFAAVLLSFLIAKLVSVALNGDRDSNGDSLSTAVGDDVEENVIMEELRCHQDLVAQGPGNENGVQVVQELIGKVDEFAGVLPVWVGENVDLVHRQEEIETECRGLPRELVEESLKQEDTSSESKELEIIEDVSGELPGGENAVEVEETINSDQLRDEEAEEEKIAVEQTTGNVVVHGDKEIKFMGGESGEKVEERKVVIESDEDDWEGIERSELEKVFAEAAKFVESGEKDEALGSGASDVQMELYGLHKVATEGPCREQPPMALKLSARAKWNAWQKMGNMSPETAMEQYITLVSERVPGWKGDESTGEDKIGSPEAANPDAICPNLGTLSSQQPEVMEKEPKTEAC